MNAAAIEHLRNNGWPVQIFDISPFSLKKDIFYFVSIFCRVILVLSTFPVRLFVRRPDVVYVSLFGGVLQYVQLIMLIWTRFSGSRCVIHHHNFSYINKWSFAFTCINRILPNSKHVVLCDSMGEALIQRYPHLGDCITVSNSSWWIRNFSACCPYVDGRRLRVGLLSNLTTEKGLHRFIKVCEGISPSEYEFILAGPIPGDEDRLIVASAVKLQGSKLRWCGPVFGEEKEKFFRSIDVFLFLSSYTNEAEPLVYYEALSYGVPFIGTSVGCCRELIMRQLVIETGPDDAVIAKARDIIVRYCSDAEFRGTINQGVGEQQILAGARSREGLKSFHKAFGN